MLHAQVAERKARQQALLGPANQGQANHGQADASTLGLKDDAGNPADDMAFDLWIKGQWSRSDTDDTRHDLGMFYIGADYRVASNMVIGVLGQFDWADEEDSKEAFAVEGTGWMIGPYVAARLADNLIFDARAAWGQSSNEVSPFNTYTDEFDTTRWLAKGQLTGAFDAGSVLVQPQVGVIYFSEEQDAYTDSLGVGIKSQKATLGRLTFGPKFATTITQPDGTTIAPYIAVKGIWDFKNAEIVDLDTGLAPSGSSDLRGRVEGGVNIELPDGMSLTGEGFYDGIGDKEVQAYGGNVRLTMPLTSSP